MNFNKRVNGSWTDTPYYVHNTSTDTITTLPAVLYPNDTTATIGLKGNTVQNGTPTYDNPIMPEGCGDLETVGTKAGQYKISISSGGTTTNEYLGQVHSTRKIYKQIITGNENTWRMTGSGRMAVRVTSGSTIPDNASCYCSHFKGTNISSYSLLNDGECSAQMTGSGGYREIGFYDSTYTSVDDFKTYLRQQYAAGTPVTVWYVLATEETAVVNEPLMKIGDYADSISGISIPTTAGANSLDVDTTVAPSEVTANYSGWHPVSAAHERENGAWT